jgi:hypothetical protein
MEIIGMKRFVEAGKSPFYRIASNPDDQFSPIPAVRI